MIDPNCIIECKAPTTIQYLQQLNQIISWIEVTIGKHARLHFYNFRDPFITLEIDDILDIGLKVELIYTLQITYLSCSNDEIWLI